jgi:hypothetical protein
MLSLLFCLQPPAPAPQRMDVVAPGDSDVRDGASVAAVPMSEANSTTSSGGTTHRPVDLY